MTGGVTLGADSPSGSGLPDCPIGELALGTKWPVLSVNAFHGRSKAFWEGELATWRLNASLDKVFHLRLVGDLSLRLMGGIADPSAPYTYLYNLRGTNGNAGHSGRAPVLLAADNTFQTMVAERVPSGSVRGVPHETQLRHFVGQRQAFQTAARRGRTMRPSVRFRQPEHHRGLGLQRHGSSRSWKGASMWMAVFAGLGVGVYLAAWSICLPIRDADNFVFKLTSSFAVLRREVPSLFAPLSVLRAHPHGLAVLLTAMWTWLASRVLRNRTGILVVLGLLTVF